MSKPYPCVYCTEDGYCKKYSDEQVTSWCVQSPCKDEKPSNADRIRAMTDEELAAKIEELCQYTFMQISVYAKPFGKEEWLDWLKQEAKNA